MPSAQPMGSDEFFQKNGIVSPIRHKMQKYKADYHRGKGFELCQIFILAVLAISKVFITLFATSTKSFTKLQTQCPKRHI